MNVDAPAFPFSAISLKWPNGCFTVLADLKEDVAKRRLALQLCHLLLLVLEGAASEGEAASEWEAASEEEEIRLGELVRSGHAAVDEGADDFNLAVAVLKGASEQGKLFKDRGGTEAVEGVLRSLDERLAALLAAPGCRRRRHATTTTAAASAGTPAAE